jgi:hypothetical protein
MFNLELLKDLCELSSPTGDEQDVKDYILMWAEANAPQAIIETDTYGNIYFTKGKIENFPTFVAHMDDVHDRVKNKKIFIHQNVMYAMDGDTMEQVGTAGDDRVGVFMALTMLQYLDNVKAAFFVEEEVGCVGSAHCNLDFFDNSAYVIQSDRRGSKDFLCTASGTTLNSKAFQKILKSTITKYGLKIAHNGGLTDVVELRDAGVNVCMANVASGYYRPHEETEIILIDHVEKLVDFYFDMVEVLEGKRWESKASKKTYSRRQFANWGKTWDWDDEYEYKNGAYVPKKFNKTANTTLYGEHAHEINEDYCRDCWGQLDNASDMYCPTCAEYYEERYGYNPNTCNV